MLRYAAMLKQRIALDLFHGWVFGRAVSIFALVNIKLWFIPCRSIPSRRASEHFSPV